MRRIALCAAVVLAATCHRQATVEQTDEHRPANEVWITPKEIKEVAITTDAVQSRAIGNPLIATGRVEFSDTRVAHIFSPVTGRVTALPAAPGQHVERGAPLAIIASPDLASAVADLQKADADVAAASKDYERQKELYAEHAAAQRDFEAAESNYRKSVAERDRAKQKVTLLGASQEGEAFALRSPLSGTVLARNVTLGMEVSGQYSIGGTPELFTVGDPDPVWVVADVFEMDLPRVHAGAPVVVSLLAYPDQRFAGTVNWISGALDPTTRTAKVRCVIRNPKHLLRPEMYATVTIETDGQPKLVAPRSAIVRVGDQMVAFVDRGKAPNGDERFERRAVTIDEAEGSQYVPVLSGLRAGDLVVTSGALLLSGESS
jgi:cobalt-zinc-cadmium efflux system membrane fusion protein